ncbi:MAG: S-layer homology domain-containing protein, partial [Oscillospiraceae bacterium]|nr:S-layer homology domain-containing protein [Oscillospiraceae bacterium]
MKTKTISRVCCLALVIVMALAFCAPALAAKDSMSNFSRSKTYSNQYSDVSSSYWAYGAIKTCYETSLMQGSDGTFKPTNNLTVAEALVMACRVHQIYHTGSNTLTNGTPWYQPYIDYAISNSIINEGDFSSYTANITRADMAYIFSRALPTKELGKLNNIGEIPDLNDAPERDRNPIALLYFSGILTGSDVYGTFHPND